MKWWIWPILVVAVPWLGFKLYLLLSRRIEPFSPDPPDTTKNPPS